MGTCVTRGALHWMDLHGLVLQGMRSPMKGRWKRKKKKPNRSQFSVPQPQPKKVQFSSVQSLSHVQLFSTPWIAARQASLSITNSRSSPRLTSIESVIPSSHLILSISTFSSIPQSFPASQSFQMSQLFASGGQKYWSFSYNISPSNEHTGLISFRMDWLDLLAVQGTLKSLLQHHSSKHQFFGTQLSL